MGIGESQDRVGKTFAGRLMLDALLGEGGMGSVYRARELDGGTVAVKLLRRDLLTDREVMGRFRREARAAARIEHPNVTALLDFDYSELGEPFLVLEYVDGITLAEQLERSGALAWRDARLVLCQIAAALAAAQAAGVIHRDLKARNVMLAGAGLDGLVKVLDFGLAKIVGGDQTTLTAADGLGYGTPEYMAPELIEGEVADHRADIYSFGIVAHELLVGRCPFQGELVDIIAQQLSEPLPALADAPALEGVEGRAVDALLARCTAKRPEQRYPSLCALQEALEALP
jgi:serine/threonine protein kinase